MTKITPEEMRDYQAERLNFYIEKVGELTTEIERLKGGQGEAVAFGSLCYGARFKYSSDEAAIWVKIGHDLIAGWDAGKVSDTWIGQPICSFSDDGDLSALVCLVASQPAPVSVVMPTALSTEDGPHYSDNRASELGYLAGYNACLDKVKELNQ